MSKRSQTWKRPALAFALCLFASGLSFIFIGFPGVCGFTGIYGDAIAHTSFGLWVALGLFAFPILGVLAASIWWIGAALIGLRTDPRGEPFR